MRRALSVCIGLACLGCGQAGETDVGQLSEALQNRGLEVTFDGCTEFAGFGSVPVAGADALVPDSYEINVVDGNAQIVVRAVQCESIAVGSHTPKAGALSQIGITLAAGDPTAFINNYTLWYVTDHAPLHAGLRAAGLSSVKEPELSHVLDGNMLTISSNNPQTPPYVASGAISTPAGEPTVFIATWWEDGRNGTVAARTEFPAITFTFDGAIELTTPAGSELADLVDATTLTFPGLNSYNAFGGAVMTVTPQ